LGWKEWDESSCAVREREFVWIDVVDDNGEEVGRLQRVFGLHELAVADSMCTAQVAKVDLYPDHVFIVAKAAQLGSEQIQYTDVSIFLAERRVITIRRGETQSGDQLAEDIQRINNHQVKGADYVVHQVLDLIVDNYFPVMQMIAEEVLQMEQRLLDHSLRRDEIERIFQLRRDTIHFQLVLARMSDICNKLANPQVPCVTNESRPYFRNVFGHLARIEALSVGLVDVIRAALEASSLLEQQRQSAITRQLAAWAGVLAIPTAIAGIYGMNFINMPETRTRWGYFVVLGLMVSLCSVLYLRFRKLGWL
jgi:magnesium transporter